MYVGMLVHVCEHMHLVSHAVIAQALLGLGLFTLGQVLLSLWWSMLGGFSASNHHIITPEIIIIYYIQ